MATIVSVHSFRGGTGKSNVSANVTAQIARTGQRVAIVDTDIQSPGVHVLFGMADSQPSPTLNDYLWGKINIEEAAHDVTDRIAPDGSALPERSKVFLVPSSMKTSDITKVLREGYDVSLLNDGFQALIDNLDLDYLIIDTHPGLNEETLLSIAISDVLLLILRPDRQDFQGTSVTVEVARKLDVARMLLVVNKVLQSFDFDAIREQVTRTYKTPVAGVLPLSEDVVRIASSDLFSLVEPDHPWSAELRAIARAAMG